MKKVVSVSSQITTHNKKIFNYSKSKIRSTFINCSKSLSIPYDVRSYDDLIAFAEETYGVHMSDVHDKRVQILWSNFEEILTDQYRKKEVTRENKRRAHDVLGSFCDDNPDDEMCRLYDV